MKVIIKQKDKEVYLMVIRLLKMSRTSLTKVCKENDLPYQRTVQRLNAERVEIDFLKKLIKKINENAELKVDFSVSLMVDNEEIIKHKSK